MIRLYKNPPVREALCEVYFGGSQWDAATQGLFFDRIKEEYPLKQQVSEITAEFRLTEKDRATRLSETSSRMRYARADGAQLIQLGPDLVVVNQLRPYPHFDEWRPVIKKTATIYSEIAAPKMVRQVGLRYINEIIIPAVNNEAKLEEYFTIYPQIPTSLGEKHGRCMLRLEMPPTHANHGLLITLVMMPPKSQNELRFTLDLYDTYAVPFNFLLEEIERKISEAHTEIERVFENFSTDKLKALFEEVRK